MALVADYSSDSSGRGSTFHKPNEVLSLRDNDSGSISSATNILADIGSFQAAPLHALKIHTAAEGEGESQDSYFVGSESESEDSASRRRRVAEGKLKNKEDEVSGPAPLSLPPPLEVITGTKAPSFLRPEATKQLAKPFHRSRAPLTKTVEHKAIEEPKAWDIASMAPKLKGEGEKRGPPGAVITAAAKRYKQDDDEVGATVTAAQVAMLGGQWQPSAGPEPAEGDLAEGLKGTKKKGPTRAMPVSDFLAKGEGGVQLPRNKQDRKDKEKEKRARGQSSVHGWKSEAEMVLRQQYD